MPAIRYRTEPPARFKRLPRRRRAAVSRSIGLLRRDGTDPAQLVSQMQAAGARFFISANADRSHFQFSYRLENGADADRVAVLLAEVKADTKLLAQVRVAAFVSIIREAFDVPARSAP